MVRWSFVLLICWLLSGVAAAQEANDWDTFAEQMADWMGDEADGNGTMSEELLDDLFEIYCNKFNLNDLTGEQLRRLPFLTDVQVEAVMDYVERHRPLLSVGELMAVTELDFVTRRRLMLFVEAGPMPRSDDDGVGAWLRRSRHDLMVRTDIPLYTKMGFASYPHSVLEKSPNKVYQGTPLYHSLRYDLRAGHHLEAGVHAEKDVGERGVDYWGAYAVLRDVGRIETTAVGHYRLSLGMGLVMNTATGFGKMMMLSSLGRIDRGLRRHSSMQESDYLTGIGTTVRLGRDWHVTTFFSRRELDGTWRTDGVGALMSLKTDGLHRTQLERSKHGNEVKTDWGGNVGWQRGTLKLSASAVVTHLSVPLAPVHNTQASYYRLYNAAGSDFANFSVAYAYYGKGWGMAGETAMSRDGGIATINTVSAELAGNRFTLVQRYYAKDYVTLNGKTFGENARPQNECGVYLGWRRNLARRMMAEAYVDAVYFPWLKYQVNQSSYSFDGMAQLSASGTKNSWSVQYRFKTRQRNVNVTQKGSEKLTQVLFTTAQRLRLQHSLQVTPELDLRSSLHVSTQYHPLNGNSWGWAAGERVAWQTQLWKASGRNRRDEGKWKLAGNIVYFRTDDYASRVYAYEPTMPYTFGMQSYYGQGLRLSLLTSLQLNYGLSLVARFSSTRYFDRDIIGSGLDEIRQNHREDLQLMLRWKMRR